MNDRLAGAINAVLLLSAKVCTPTAKGEHSFGQPSSTASWAKCPQALREKVFDRLFVEAEIVRFTPRELRKYEDS